MAVSKKIINYLESNKVKYDLVEHRQVYTAWDLSQTLHISPSSVAKTVIIKFKNKVPAIAILPADKNLDFKKISNIAFDSVKKIEKKLAKYDLKDIVPLEWNWPNSMLKGKSYDAKFASEKWIKEKITKKPASVPPFGKMYKMPVFMDKKLIKEKYIYIPSGDFRVSIKISPKQYVKLESPIEGNFSIKK